MNAITIAIALHLTGLAVFIVPYKIYHQNGLLHKIVREALLVVSLFV